VASEKVARTQAQQTLNESRITASAAVKQIHHEQKLADAMSQQVVGQLPLVVKADVHGSLESLISSLDSLATDEVKVKIVAQGVGPISKSDISIANSAEARIVGFNVEMGVAIKQLAQREGVDVQLYKVIYELLDDVKEHMGKLLAPEIVEEVVGTLKVKGVFKTTKSSVIAGGEVTSGKVMPELLVRLANKDKAAGGEFGKLKTVQREQDQVKEVKEGDMCGLQITTKDKVNLAIDDKLEFFTREEKTRSL
jgi:translation initiation factor IF-2